MFNWTTFFQQNLAYTIASLPLVFKAPRRRGGVFVGLI